MNAPVWDDLYMPAGGEPGPGEWDGPPDEEDPRARVTPATPETDLPEVYSVRKLADLPSADESYIVGDGILTTGGKGLIYAKSGAGKTTLLDFLAGPLATGQPFLGRYAIDRPRRVLVVQGELSLPELSSHAQQLVSTGFDSDNLRFARMTKLKLPAGEDLLCRLIERERAEIVALDPWYRLFSGESSDKPEQVGQVFDAVDRLLDRGIVEAAIVVHHANVTGLRTAGSWAFEGWPSTILRLERVEGTQLRTLKFEKIRAPGSSVEGTTVRIALGDGGYLVSEGAPVAPVGAGATVAVQCVIKAGGQMYRRPLLETLMGSANVKERQANKYLSTAIQAKQLVAVQVGHETVYQLGAPE